LPLLAPLIIIFAGRRRLNLLMPAFFSGWWAMSSEILLMVLYQSVAGNLFSRLGLLAGLFMFGIAVGARSGEGIARSRANTVAALKAVLASGVLIAVAAGLLVPVLLASFDQRTAAEYVIYVLSVLFGTIPGLGFNLSAGQFAQLHTTESPGKFYGADLLGAAASGFVTTILILPLLGIQAGFFVLALTAVLITIYCFASD
jgi:predicted membrane-bound spermidine synthase